MRLFWKFFKKYKSKPISKKIASMDDAFLYDDGEIISKDSISHVLKTAINRKVFYIKRYTQGGKGLRRYISRTRCRAEWENILFCQKLDIPTPELVVVGEEYGFLNCFPKRALLITEEVKNTQDLEVVARENDLFQDKKWRTKILLTVADYVKRLHDKRFIHNDLNWRNILIQLNKTPKVCFFDMPLGQKRFGYLFYRFRLKDLARLDKLGKQYLRKTERLRFYKAYFEIDKLRSRDKLRIQTILGYFDRKKA